MIKIYKDENLSEKGILNRSAELPDVREAVAAIIDNVRRGGDRALFEYTERFDKVKLKTLEVTA